MKNKLFYIAALLTLLSCSKHPGEVRIQGRFAHLEQGEFYIYSSDRELGRLDTVHIKDGEFAYTMPLQGSCILHLLYPNYSQLTFFAHDGDDLLSDAVHQHGHLAQLLPLLHRGFHILGQGDLRGDQVLL